MKKTLIAIALALTSVCFAAQNDTLVTFSTQGPDVYEDSTRVLDGECYALVWTADEVTFQGFNSDGTPVDGTNSEVLRIVAAAKDGKCPSITFEIPAEAMESKYKEGGFRLYLLDTRVGGVPSVPVGNTVARVNAYGVVESAEIAVVANVEAVNVEDGSAFELAGPIAYADLRNILDGERFMLVGYPAGSQFAGLTYDGRAVCADDKVLGVFATAANGGCAATTVDIADPDEGYEYEIIVVDSRLPDGTLSALQTLDSVQTPKFVRAWGRIGRQGDAKVYVNWVENKLGKDEFLKQFDFDPTPYLADGYAAVYDDGGRQVKRLGEIGALYGLVQKSSWMVFPLPEAFTNQIPNEEMVCDTNYSHLRDVEIPKSFVLDSTYRFDAFKTDAEREIVNGALVGKTITHADFNLMETLTALNGGKVPTSLASLNQAAMTFLTWYMRAVPFFGWNCDFVVSFDRKIAADSFILAGYYNYMEAWAQYADKFRAITGGLDLPWIGSSADHTMAAGEEFRLLKSYKGASVHNTITVNYEEICNKVKTFLCGVYNNSSANWGTMITVKLNMYPNTGVDNEETDSYGNPVKYTVGTYKYTFKGPLNVKFYRGGEELSELAISTNHAGRSEFPLPTCASADEGFVFTGWTNGNGVVVSTIPAMVHTVSEKNPVKTWYAGDDDTLKLYASFKPAKKLEITVKPAEEGGKETTSQIKVTKEWLDTVVEEGTSEKSDAEIKEVLEQPVANTESDLTYWQAYLLGIDPTDPNAELKVEKTNGDEDDKALVVSTVQVVAPDAGIRVGYSLDKVDSDESGVRKAGEEQATKDLKIDLNPEGDTPTGYYKMNVIFTPTEDGVEKADEKVKIPADNTIGVLKVESDEKLVPIAVPWNSLDNGGEISAAEIVKTSTLSDNDMLHVYDTSSGQKAYHNYKLENGEWKWVASYQLDENGVVTETPAVKPEDDTISRGSSVWLERGNTEKPFYLIGQYKGDAPAKSVVKAPEVGQERPEYSLIAPTGIEDTDLNAVPDLQAAATANKDDMIVVKRNGIAVRFSPTVDGKWGYNKTVYSKGTANGRVIKSVQTVTDDAKVQAGLGIWYLSTGTEEMQINWSAQKSDQD